MPSTSKRQMRALYAKKGEAWVKAHHFDRVAGQPKKSKRKRK